MKSYYLIFLILLICLNFNTISKIKNNLLLKSLNYDNLIMLDIIHNPKKIVIFVHICPVGNWRYILNEQMSLIISSGLYNKISKLYYCCIGKKCNLVNKFFKKISKSKNLSYYENEKIFEIETINSIIKYSKKNKDTYILYLHTKGVTSKANYWRNLMNYWNIIKHEDCISCLKKGFNTVGINLLIFKNHYSGNFWWANSNYLKKLNLINRENILLPLFLYKLEAEQLLLSKYENLKHISLHGPYYLSLDFGFIKTGLYKLNDMKMSENDYVYDIKIL